MNDYPGLSKDEPGLLGNVFMKTAKRILAALAVIVCVLIAALFVLEIMGYTLFDKYGNMDGSVVRDNWQINYAPDPAMVAADPAANKYVRHIQPVKKYGPFKKAAAADRAYRLETDDGEYAGLLYRFNGKGNDHYCFIAADIIIAADNSMRINENLPNAWYELDHVTVSGEECKLEKGAFFSTDKEFESFLLGDCKLILKPYESLKDMAG